MLTYISSLREIQALLSLALTKIAIFSIAFIILSTIIVVLWQRQPQGPTTEPETTKGAQISSDKTEKEEFQISPTDGTITSSTNFKFTGKSQAGSLIVIYSNQTNAVTKTQPDDTFELETTAEEGLNLFKVVVIDATGQIQSEKNLSLYISGQDVSKAVAAGSVKSIFDNLITVTTASGNKNIRTGKSTDFDVPQEEDVQEATAEIDAIRIGDYVIATGDASDEDSIIAKNLQVLRENKPVLTKELAIGKIASNVKQNLFPAKNNKDGKIIEFTLNKDSDISVDGQEGKAGDITKDKSAIIIYHPVADKNIADLIYLLP